MKLILRADVDTLGRLGDIVAVKPGFGRNYLIPQGLGMLAKQKKIDTLEAKEPLGAGNFFCIGEAGDVWQQTPKALLKKYDVTGVDGESGALVCTPKPDNEVECFEYVGTADIIAGIESGKRRILTGNMSSTLFALSRFMPDTYPALLRGPLKLCCIWWKCCLRRPRGQWPG